MAYSCTIVEETEKTFVVGIPPMEAGSTLIFVLPHVQETVTVTYVPAVQFTTVAGIVVSVYGRVENPLIDICAATALLTAVSVELDRIAVRSPTAVAAWSVFFRNIA
jgi:hypothetical protein